ncbi:hypothetical protein Ae201684_016265 [Aphanomyces euteiches]|uniref:Leucine-rich repeat-containing N-terminal plant-type domain-containing protein n=1 Tax=Aphanomyces euteiches TaxID=100861 RepID=A0A6G0WFL3_9STRA|nr:hypothetical protein Ae201684_016265 [Aphanomyces euteiches]
MMFKLLALALVAARVNAARGATLRECQGFDGNFPLPCLQMDSTTVLLEPNYTLDLSKQSISTIDVLPSMATSLDLSFNSIQSLGSQPIPPRLKALSLPATLETLDLSYNQGGMAWFSMAQVATSNLTHLYLRGNNLSTIVLTQQTLPPSLTYLDLSDNPNVIVFADRSTYTSLARQQIVLKVNTSLATVSGFCLGSLVLPISPTAYVCIEIEGWATAPPSQAPQTTMPSSTSSTTICIYVATIVGVMWSIFLILYIVTVSETP